MENRALTALFFLLSALGARGADSQPPIVISAAADRQEILIGDQIDYRVSVEWDTEAIEFQRIEPSQMLGVFEIVDFQQVEDRSLAGHRRRRSWKLVLSTFETGDFEIPPFTVKYKNARGQEIEGQTQPIQIRVKSALDTAEKTLDIRPLKAPAEIPVDPKYQRRIAALAAAAAALLAAGLWLVAWRRKRRRAGPEEWVPPRPIEEMAFEELEALAGEELAARGEIKAYYSRLSEILRVYLGRRFAILAMDMTSFELLEALDGRVEKETARPALERFCEESDMAKFAKWRASEERCAQAMETVRCIVRETTPRPAPAPAPETPAPDNSVEGTPEDAAAGAVPAASKEAGP